MSQKPFEITHSLRGETQPPVSEHVMKAIRQRNGYDAEDTSNDAEFIALSPLEKLRNVVAWELGDTEWADRVLKLATDCGMVINTES